MEAVLLAVECDHQTSVQAYFPLMGLWQRGTWPRPRMCTQLLLSGAVPRGSAMPGLRATRDPLPVLMTADSLGCVHARVCLYEGVSI